MGMRVAIATLASLLSILAIVGCDQNENADCTTAECAKPANCGDAVCENGENCSTCPGDCGECPAPAPESHFGVNMSGLDYTEAAGYIAELGGQIFIRDARTPWPDDYGWKQVKNAGLVGACRSSCDPSRSPCDCNVGGIYYSSPASRKPLPPIQPNWFLNFEASRYDDKPPADRKSLGPAFPSGHENAYVAYVDYLVQGYQDKAVYWEVGNEAESPMFWAGTPQEYGELVTLASREIKKYCPECRVGMSFAHPGLAPKQPQLNEEWYRVIGSACASIDFIDAHFFDSKFIMPGQLDRLKQACPGKEFISSETGVPDYDMSPKPQNAGGSPERQAQDLIKYNTLLFAEGYNKIFWYLKDTDYGTGEIFLHNGLLDEMGLARKPAFTAYKTMIAKVDRFTAVMKIGDGQYRYEFADREPVYVLWCDSGSCPLPAEISGMVRVTDYLGGERVEGAEQIVLNERPIFVEREV